MPQQPEPDWLIQARKEGRILSETGVNLSGQGGNVSTPDPRLTDGESEAEFQKRVIDLAQSLGWRVAFFRKVRVQRGDSTYWETPIGADGKGWLDLFMVRWDRRMAMELKVERNKPTDEQLDWYKWLNEAGIPAYFFKPIDWSEIVQLLT